MQANPFIEKFGKPLFSFTTLIYAVLCVALKETLFLEMDGGFVYTAEDPFITTLFYTFLVLAVFSTVNALFLVPKIRVPYTAKLLSYAFSESIALYGLIYFLMTGELAKGLSFMVLALLLIWSGLGQPKKAL